MAEDHRKSCDERSCPSLESIECGGDANNGNAERDMQVANNKGPVASPRFQVQPRAVFSQLTGIGISYSPGMSA